jgi:hypothetical protein
LYDRRERVVTAALTDLASTDADIRVAAIKTFELLPGKVAVVRDHKHHHVIFCASYIPDTGCITRSVGLDSVLFQFSLVVFPFRVAQKHGE